MQLMQYNKDFFNKIKAIDKALDANEVDGQILKLIEEKVYEEYFFNNVSSEVWFDALKKKDCFNPKNNAVPILDKEKEGYKIPQWIVLQYLEKISKKSRSLDDELLAIIKEASLYKDSKGNHIDNYRTWWFFVKILLNIPLSKVPYEIFEDVMPIWLTSIFDLTLPGADLVDDLLPSYLKQIENKEDVKKVERLLNILLSVKEPQTKKDVLGERVEIQTKIDNHWLEESLIDKNNATLIAQKCTNAPIFDLADTIRNIFSKKHEKQDFSSLWLRDLTREQKKSLHNGEYFLAVILRKLVLEKAKYNQREGSEIIKKFLSEAYPHFLFKRLALLLIAENWKSYKDYFDQILDNKTESYFDTDSLHPELSYLLTKNGNELTKQQLFRISKFIKNGPSRDLPNDRKEEYKNYWKQSWYKTLESIPEFKKLYDDVKKITKKDIAPISYEGDGESREIAFDKSPISPEEFLKKPNEEIVQFITNYTPKGEFPKFAPEGIYRTFQSAVELDPIKFTKNLEPFRIRSYHMLLSLYNGLEEAWKQKKDISWVDVIDFTLKLLQEKWFWKPYEKGGHYDYFGWSLSAIGDLIQEGCKSDEWAFPVELHTDIEKVISLLIDNLTYDKDSYQGDGVSHALNSSWGKILSALVYLGLREARLNDKDGQRKASKWSNVLKNDFDKSLDKDVYEAYTLLGQYLSNLHYVDKEWAESKVKNIHLIKNEKLFQAFMEGYLFTNKIYVQLYKLLKDSYEKALRIDLEDKRSQERLIQHIAVGYLRGNEELDNNSLLDKLFETKSSEHILKIIEFLWHQRNYVLDGNGDDKKIEKERAEFKKRILILWDFIIDIFNKKKALPEEDKKVLSELSKFAIYLTKIDRKSFGRLLVSAPYVTFDFDSPYFIEYLNELKNNGDKKESAKFVALLFLAMLKGAQELIPDYKWENVEEIVIFLYQVGKTDAEVKDLANQICIFYAEHRNLRLRKLYEENNAAITQ